MRRFPFADAQFPPPTFPHRHAQMFLQQIQSLYGGSPNVSMFKGSGTAQQGPYLDMPDNSSSGDVRGHQLHIETQFTTSKTGHTNAQQPPVHTFWSGACPTRQRR